jgi:hypothetical protein
VKKPLLAILIAISFYAVALDTLRIDLKPVCFKYDGVFTPYDDNARVAYLPVQKCTGDAIEISSENFFSIFLNQRLAHFQVKDFKMTVVDLKRAAGETGMIAIVTTDGLGKVDCETLMVASENPLQHKPTSTSSFMIVVGIILFGSLILLARTNPGLTIEYFNLSKTFNLKRADDMNLGMRLTSLSNLFFFLLCSTAGGILFFLLRNGDTVPEIRFYEAMLRAGWLIILIFMLLILKVLWLRLFAALFGQAGFGLSQFHDYLKILLASFNFSLLILLFLVMIGVDWSSWIAPLQYFIVITSVIFVALIFLKLLVQGGFTVFHLFSYLCVSELIPLIILLNIFF